MHEKERDAYLGGWEVDGGKEEETIHICNFSAISYRQHRYQQKSEQKWHSGNLSPFSCTAKVKVK